MVTGSHRLLFVGRLSTILSCVVFLSQQAVATTVALPVDNIVSATRDLLELIVSEGKPIPDNIRQVYDRIQVKEKADEMARGSFVSRIKLFGDGGPVTDDGRQLVAVTTNQISSDVKADGVGRWVIWKTAGGFSKEWLYESAVQEIFQSSGHSLPNQGVWKQQDVKHMGDIGARSMQYAGQTPPRDDPNLRGKGFVEDEGWVAAGSPTTGRALSAKPIEQPPEAKPSPTRAPGLPPRFERSTWLALAALIAALVGLLWLVLIKRIF